jgi:LCP family protein required for cell wall assembly
VTTPAEPPQGDSASDAAQGADPAGAADADGAVGATDADPQVDSDTEATPDAGADAATDAGANAAGNVAADADANADSPAQPREPAPAFAANVPGPVPGPGPSDEPGPHRRFRWLRVVAVCTAFLVLALAGGTWYVYQRLNGNITTDTVTETELKAQDSQRPTEGPTEAENILLIGSDSRGSGNEKYGKDTGTQRSDTTILLHLSADRSNATAVSIPRDLMTHVPQCTKPDGSKINATFEEFNWAFEFGGAACTIRAVEQMTGVRIDHHLVVDFNGFKNMVNAVGGVDVCVPEPIHDTQAHLNLPAGRQKLNGEQALGYVRARHSIGDGSDTERIGRQQDFLASLVKKVQSNGVLLNPVKVYPLLNAATKSLTADPGLDSLSELYKLAQSLQKVPTGAIHFLTVPQEPYVADHNRDQLIQSDADQLFAALQADQPVNVTNDGTANGSSGNGSATGKPTSSGTASPSTTSTATPTTTPSAPTYQGTTADRALCGTS